MTKFIIMNSKGKAVQVWTFAKAPRIIFANSPEWAMKFETEKSANRIKDSLVKNFKENDLRVMKIKIENTFNFI